MTDRYDVIIVGSGPGGGTMAWRLAQTGKRVLLLERGDYLPRERENWDTQAVFVDARYQAPETWYGARWQEPSIRACTTLSAATARCMARCCCGCAKKTSTRSGIRMASRRRGRSNTTSFEPYYQAAEELYHVHGLRGEDPTEPPARKGYAYPPLTHEPRIQQLFDGAEARRPSPLPSAGGNLAG